MLRLTNISVSYKNKIALKGINAEFQGCHVYGVVGKSGSGKTTLAKAITSIVPHEGEIMLDEVPLDRHEHRIALIPQNQGLIPWKTVRDNIILPLKLRNVYEAAALKTVTEELGISELLDKYPRHISGGEKQRVAMARGFLAKPHILILDEAFSALDAITKEEAHQVFLRTLNQHPVTTLLITHDVEEVLELAQTIIILKEGEIAAIKENPCWGRDKEEDFAQFLTLQKEIKKAL